MPDIPMARPPPLQIVEELWLWLLMEDGRATEATLARMVGLDIVGLRDRYLLFLAIHDTESAEALRHQQIVDRLERRAAERQAQERWQTYQHETPTD